MSSIELDGFDEFEKFVSDMVLSESDKRKAVRSGIKIVAKEIESNSPVGKSKQLAKIKIKVKNTGLATEATANSKAFYDVFQEFGTSEQKANVGYFERAVENSKGEAISEVAKIIFEKMR